MDAYRIEKIIGRGSQGTVYKCHKIGGDETKKIAIKKIPCEDIAFANKAMREMLAIKNLSHINLVEYTDLFLDINDETGAVSVCIVMPYYTGGDLEMFISETYSKGNLIPINQIYDFTIQISSCVAYLHENLVMHRDLKPENVFVTRENEKSPIVLKLGDFGVAKEILKDSMRTTFVGTPNYMAPEISEKNYDEKVDLFSLGAILYKLSTNKERQFWVDLVKSKDKSLVYDEVKKDILKNHYPEELANLTMNLLSVDPSKRPTAKQVKEGLIKLSCSETSSLSFILMFPVDELRHEYGVDFVNQLERAFLNDPELKEITVRSVDGEHELREEGAKYLAKALQVNKMITKIDLAKTNIGEKGLIHLQNFLKENKTISSVQLSNNKIGDKGVKILQEALSANFSIREIDLSYNNIRLEGAQSIADALEKNCESAMEKVDWESMVASKYFGITVLNLTGNEIGDEGAGVVCEKLKNITTLREFNLSSNNIDQTGAQYIAEALKSNTSINVLTLDDNRIGIEGFRLLCEALDKNKSVQRLSVSKNKIATRKKNSVLKDFPVILKQSAVIHLTLSGNFIDDDFIKYLSDGLKFGALLHLDLSSNDIRDPGIKSLSMVLKYNNQLAYLNLSDNKIGPDGLKDLCKVLEKKSSLKTLLLNDNSNLGDTSVKMLCLMLSNIRKDSPNLESNFIGGGGGGGGGGASNNASNGGGVGGSILSNFFSGTAKKRRSSQTGGQPVVDSNGSVIRFHSQTSVVPSCDITTLGLQNTSIGDEGIKTLADCLRLNVSLTALYLQKNKFTDDSLLSLGLCLRENMKLKLLDLSFSDIRQIKTIAESCWVNSIEVLNLKSNKITASGASELARALAKSKHLNFLDLSGNRIENEGFMKVCEAFETNKLVKVDVSDNDIKNSLIIEQKEKYKNQILSSSVATTKGLMR